MNVANFFPCFHQLHHDTYLTLFDLFVSLRVTIGIRLYTENKNT